MIVFVAQDGGLPGFDKVAGHLESVASEAARRRRESEGTPSSVVLANSRLYDAGDLAKSQRMATIWPLLP